MVTLHRWRKAQKYEQNFWAKLAKKIEAGTRDQLSWYEWKASELEKRLERSGDRIKTRRGRVLEIGSGPIGILNFLDWEERFAIDPLENFYQASETLIALRKPSVTYLKGNGAELPFPDNFFSLVIIDNVIDHTLRPGKILEEVNRVLTKLGTIYLSVNVRTWWGTNVHRILATLCIDKGHPHSYTIEGIRDLLQTHQFRICNEEIEDYHAVKGRNYQSKAMKEKVKAYSGISEFQYSAISEKV